MFANIIDGKKVSSLIIDKINKKLKSKILNKNRPPGLAVIFIGNNPVSEIYINKKRIVCKKIGFLFRLYNLSPKESESNLIRLIEKLNNDKFIDGIIVQLPIPKNINVYNILKKINPKKDVDGLHPFNIGSFLQGFPVFYPCASKAIITLLNYYKIGSFNLNTVIVGASNIVGCPVGLILLHKGYTVSITHSLTLDLYNYVINADLLIVAIGKSNFIPGSWIKKGAVVFDVGVNRLNNGEVVGDVCYKEACKKASWITPVPGGVGPVTIASLIENVMHAYENSGFF